ncbi:unnamed protein product [Clavelina lepadiformis]|uniref:TIR domain-containing protein n=1 Tax=Clavelina lepadiformis TaxID=159417 RepID=A0ABP0G5Y2_CLALP
MTNQSNVLNTEIPSTKQTGFRQPKQPISASNSQTAAPSTSPSIANLPTTSSAETNNPQATNSPCGPGTSQHQDNNKGNQHIMISYNWNDSKDLAHKISDELSAAGYKVWIDKNEMRGDIYDKMYEAVDNAYLVLMFLSENYKLSENCKREGKLAADKRKRIIPIITHDNYKMDGWTALLVSAKLYYDFSKESFEDNFDKLIQEIDHPNEQQQFTNGLETNKAGLYSYQTTENSESERKTLEMFWMLVGLIMRITTIVIASISLHPSTADVIMELRRGRDSSSGLPRHRAVTQPDEPSTDFQIH